MALGSSQVRSRVWSDILKRHSSSLRLDASSIFARFSALNCYRCSFLMALMNVSLRTVSGYLLMVFMVRIANMFTTNNQTLYTISNQNKDGNAVLF